MPRSRFPSTGTTAITQQFNALAANERSRGDQFFFARLQEKQNDKDRVLNALKAFAKARKQREQERRAKKKSTGGLFAAGGGAGGLALGAILAAPTGGLSIAAGAALGGAIGGAAGGVADIALSDPGSGGAAGVNDNLQRIPGILDANFQDNPFITKVPNPTGKTGGDPSSGPHAGRQPPLQDTGDRMVVDVPGAEPILIPEQFPGQAGSLGLRSINILEDPTQLAGVAGATPSIRPVFDPLRNITQPLRS